MVCHTGLLTYTIAVCTVKTPDDGQRNCPKYIGFYPKNKLEKLVHLVCFIIRILLFTFFQFLSESSVILECHKNYRQVSASVYTVHQHKAKLSLYLIELNILQAYGGMEAPCLTFLSSG